MSTLMALLCSLRLFILVGEMLMGAGDARWGARTWAWVALWSADVLGGAARADAAEGGAAGESGAEVADPRGGAAGGNATRGPPLMPPEAGTTDCDYTPGVDYVGFTAHALGPSNLTACCAACVAHPKCGAAVLSSLADSPPRECWLKFGPVAEVKKDGVWACRPKKAPPLQLVPLESVPDHPSQFRNSQGARRWGHHRRYYPVRAPLTPSQRHLQKKASGTLMFLLIFMVLGQMSLYCYVLVILLFLLLHL